MQGSTPKWRILGKAIPHARTCHDRSAGAKILAPAVKGYQLVTCARTGPNLTLLQAIRRLVTFANLRDAAAFALSQNQELFRIVSTL